jgi:serine/threonine protein kinase
MSDSSAHPPDSESQKATVAVSVLPPAVAELQKTHALGPADSPKALAVVDRYRILRELGAGGMGVVLLAQHMVTEASVAIKMLRPELVHEPRAVHRFLVEARHMHNMSHPSIVPILDVSDREAGPYYVMPYYGRTLSRMIKPGQALESTLVSSIARNVASALTYAHARGIIHRDVKPANVLLADDDRVFLTDFGLVRTVFNDSVVDVSRSHCEGTVTYMSPAVARGEAEDTRCDIYALGALLYELLSGDPPYEGRSREEVLRQVLAGPPTPILSKNPQAPAELVRIAEFAMARELRDRYSSMKDLLADLERVHSEHAILGPHGDAPVSRAVPVSGPPAPRGEAPRPTPPPEATKPLPPRATAPPSSRPVSSSFTAPASSSPRPVDQPTTFDSLTPREKAPPSHTRSSFWWLPKLGSARLDPLTITLSLAPNIRDSMATIQIAAADKHHYETWRANTPQQNWLNDIVPGASVASIMLFKSQRQDSIERTDAIWARWQAGHPTHLFVLAQMAASERPTTSLEGIQRMIVPLRRVQWQNFDYQLAIEVAAHQLRCTSPVGLTVE